MKPIIFIISEIPETNQAISYWHQHHHAQKVILISTSLISLTSLRRHRIPFISLDTIIKPSVRLDKLAPLPFQLSQHLIHQAQVIDDGVNITQLFVDVIQFKLYLMFSQYYSLKAIVKKLKPKKLLVSPRSFSASIVKLVAQQEHLPIKLFNFNFPYPSWANRLSRLKFALHYFRSLFFLEQSSSFLLPKSKGSKRILFFSNGLHLLSYSPIIKALSQSPHAQVQVINDKPSLLDRFYIHQAGIKTISLPQRLTLSEKALGRQLNYELTRTLKPFTLKPGLNPIVRQTLKEIIASNLFPIIAKYLKAKRLIAQYQPQLVITTHDPSPSALAFVLPAQAGRIKTTVLLHGLPSQNHYFLSDSQIVWGQHMKSWLIKQGVAASRLKVGGYPTTFKSSLLTQAETGNSISTIGIIVSGHGHYEWYQTTFFDQLFIQLQKINLPVKLLVRLHPMQQLTCLKALAQTYQLNLKINQDLWLEEFIAKTTLVITQVSTAAIVPLIARKPTILINPWQPLTNQSILTHTPAYLSITQWSDLPALITKLLTVKTNPTYIHKQNRFLADYCTPLSSHINHQISSDILKGLQ